MALSTLGLALALIAAASFGGAALAEVRLVDDSGATVVLPQPARRIVSIAPHVTELLFAAGAGDRIVGATEYSDYPEAAKKIPRVGGLTQLDLERILGLQPDVIVVWMHGSARRQIEALKTLGVPIYYNEPRSLADIARSIRALGTLAGTQARAEAAAADYERRVAALRAEYAQRSPVPIYYQVWRGPLMTVNGAHLISDVIRTCGGVNVFASLEPLVPVLSAEAVLDADPEAIGTGVHPAERDDGLGQWRKWPQLRAVARGNLFTVPADVISRHTPRVVEGARVMCEALEVARRRRPS